METHNVPRAERPGVESCMEHHVSRPVWRGALSKPSVVALRSGFLAYGAAADSAGNPVVLALSSPDLLRWSLLGEVLHPREPDLATTVFESEGRFSMIYTRPCGRTGRRRVVLATSDAASGAFVDAVSDLLPSLECADDPCVVCDRHGDLVLYVADRRAPDAASRVMAVRLGPNGTPIDDPVTALAMPGARSPGGFHDASGHWLVHAVGEGGGWRSEIRCAVAGGPLGSFREIGEPVLRSIPGSVRSPGRPSMVEGPSGCLFLLFDAWDQTMTVRRLHAAPLRHNGEGLRAETGTWFASGAGVVA